MKKKAKKKVAKKPVKKIVKPIVDEVSYKGKKVWFFDEYHGFWRIGDCYKETKKQAHIRILSFLFKVDKTPTTIMLFDPKVDPWTKPKDSVKSQK